MHSRVKKTLHARQRSHARNRSPSTPRVKEKTISSSQKHRQNRPKLALKQAKAEILLADLSQRYGARPISVRLLDTTSRWRRFARGLRRELFFSGLSRRWIYEQFVWYEPLYSLLDFFVPSTRTISLWKRDGKERMREEKKIIIALNVRREMFGLKRTHKRRKKYAGVNTHGRRSSTTQQCT